MKRLLMAFLLFGTAVPLHAGVGMYFVDGMEQFPVEKKSMSEWCDWMTIGPPDQKPETPRELLGIMYDSLMGAHMDLQEPLPEKLDLKNNLKIGKYYVFSFSGEFLNLSSWLVMDRNGHIVHAFSFGYGSGRILPRVHAVWIGISMYGIPSRNNMELHEQNDEMWIYYVDKQKKTRLLRSFVKGNVSVVTQDLGGAYCFDWPLEYESPTIRQDDLVPILREFVNIQVGKSKAVEAEREILSLLPRAKKLIYDHNRRTISYGNPPPPPQAPDRGVIPSFEKSWKVVAEKLHFPDASGYRQTEESGPHPQRLTHCCQAWLEKCGVLYVLEKWKAEASIARRCLLSDEDRSAVYVAVAQCGTRAYALEGLARMRLWQAQLEEKARRKAMGEKEEDPPVEPDPVVVAGRTNVSDSLVGDYALYLKGTLDKFGRATREGRYGAIFFVRGTTAACVVAEDLRRDMLPVARRIDRELKKMHALGPEKREPRKWEPDDSLENKFNKYMKSRGVDPETGGPWKGGEDREPDSEEPE
ncbi:MAG: hypothetical protein EGQ81_08015 [Akkermansia sp.]|nr:hypothetical protein [Akkermansia sp.]